MRGVSSGWQTISAVLSSLENVMFCTASPLAVKNRGPCTGPRDLRYSDMRCQGQEADPGLELIMWVDVDPECL